MVINSIIGLRPFIAAPTPIPENPPSEIGVSMILFGSLAGGILLGYTFAIFSILSAKSDIRRLNNKNKRLSDELDDLRNVAIEDGVYDDEYGDE